MTRFTGAGSSGQVIALPRPQHFPGSGCSRREGEGTRPLKQRFVADHAIPFALWASNTL